MVDHEEKERTILLDRVYMYKPWLKKCVPKLKITKPDIIRKNYPITDKDIEEF